MRGKSEPGSRVRSATARLANRGTAASAKGSTAMGAGSRRANCPAMALIPAPAHIPQAQNPRTKK